MSFGRESLGNCSFDLVEGQDAQAGFNKGAQFRISRQDGGAAGAMVAPVGIGWRCVFQGIFKAPF